MSEKKCVFQYERRLETGLFKPDAYVTACGLTLAGEYASYFCLCDPDICPIYQLWKMETK